MACEVKIATAVVLALTLAGQAQAQSSTIVDPIRVGRVFAPSKGWQKCAHWLAARADDREDARRLEAWALGYATAASLYDSPLSDDPPPPPNLNNAQLFSEIDSKCRSGAGGIGGAVVAILHDHAGR